MFKEWSWNISRQNGGSAAGHSARRMTPRCQAVFVAFSAAALAYTLYFCVDETGPFGYAMKLELDLFGRAEVYQAASLVIGGWYLGLMMIAGIIGQFVPSLVYTDSPHQFQINRPSRPMSWKRILGISAIPILIAAVIAPGVYVLMHRDDQKMVYDLDLTSGAAAQERQRHRGRPLAIRADHGGRMDTPRSDSLCRRDRGRGDLGLSGCMACGASEERGHAVFRQPGRLIVDHR